MHTLDPTIFACPPATWRGAYFWSINDRVDERRIREQVRHMHRQGQGGAFYHPRPGMTDAYLGRRFFEGVDAALAESRAQGMLFYLYDEDRFPSGFAGGYVMEADERHAALQLVRTVADGAQTPSYDVVPVSATSRFANRPFPSLLSEEAVAEFIRVTYDAYAARYGGLFGSEIPAFFTDEPNVRTDRRIVSLPWAADFADVFRERKGYDIADELDALFEGGDGAQQVRYDYWEVIASLFEERFTAQIARWCDEHGIMFTGHFWEHVFPNPTFTGSVMPNYARMQAPGIDMLFHPDWTAGRAEVQFGNNLVVRELVSVGNQLGKRRLLSETHGAGGWDYEFSAMKRMLDWQFAHGVNLVCQHLYHYSLRGHRKRDFPQSFGPHQPWSQSYRLLGDYIGRLSYAVSAGRQRSDVLVLHPVGSTWTEWNPLAEDPAAEPAMQAINDGIAGVLATLSANQIAHDLGDEHLLERHGSVGAGPSLVVGRMAYRVVVLPTMVTIRTETLQLLSEFVTAGGVVLAAGSPPELLEGRVAPRLGAQLDLGQPLTGEQLVAALLEADAEHLRVQSVSGPRESLFYQRRETDAEEIVFLANVDRAQSVSVALDETLAGAELWDPVAGTVTALEPQHAGSKTFVLPPAGSLLIRVPAPAAERFAVRRPEVQSHGSVIIGPEAWRVTQLGMNALVLKRCRVKLNAGAWSAEEGVLAADDRVRDELGMERRSMGARQPWMYSDDERAVTAAVSARFTFQVAALPEGRIELALEDPERVEIAVNGTPVASRSDAWYRDEAFRLVDIAALCTTGENTVDLSWSDYGVDDGMEWIYVVGDFAVAGGGAVEHAIVSQTPLTVGEWTAQGRPYYSGSARYEAIVDLPADLPVPAERAVALELEGVEAIAVDVIVNEQTAGTMGWAPWTLDVGRLVRPGANRIALVVHNSMQNLLGPHDEDGRRGIVTPGSFGGTEDTYFDETRFDGSARLRLYRPVG
ncbi:MAG: glycosyl hydrolase [Spirochaetota bacterium]